MLSKAGLQHLAKHLNASSQIVMRADFNVPLEGGKITDANRIKGTPHVIQQPSQQSKSF
jgi:3-phosphoglycerate kinase